MSLSEFEWRTIEKFAKAFLLRRRPPPEIRESVDLDFKIENQSVFIFEIRPQWNSPSKKIESYLAKTTYVKAQKKWRVFWQRSDLKWHTYDPNPYVKNIEH
jgi:hypothetical protein